MVTDKWSLFVIYNLAYYDVLRFTAIKNNIRGISSRMLSVTLKKLENRQVIERTVFAEAPPTVEYKLTEFGKQLAEKTIDINSCYLVITDQLPINKMDEWKF